MGSGSEAMAGSEEPKRDTNSVGLSEAELGWDPLPIFRAWFDQAVAAQLPEPTAMALGTVNADGARMSDSSPSER